MVKMNFNVVIDENKYTNKFFKSFKSYEEDIKDNIYNKLEEIINFKTHKIKTAYHLKRKNNTIYEYKIVVKNYNFRAAYIQVGNNIEVFFISITTIKKDFVKLLENTNLVD
ncbi:MAG: hypothetical protein RR942_05240 [Romboutsia sp.]